MLRRRAPAPVDVEICYPSDGPVDDATTCERLAAEYAGVAWTGCNLTVMHGVQEWRDGETRTCLPRYVRLDGACGLYGWPNCHERRTSRKSPPLIDEAQ